MEIYIHKIQTWQKYLFSYLRGSCWSFLSICKKNTLPILYRLYTLEINSNLVMEARD